MQTATWQLIVVWGWQIGALTAARAKRHTVLAALLACVSMVVSCSREESYEKPLTPVHVRAVEQYVAGGSGKRYTANIAPYTQVNLSFKVGGYIQEILQVRGADGRRRDIQPGDRVTKGTVLARVRQIDYVEKVHRAKAHLAEGQKSLEQAKAGLARSMAAWKEAKLNYMRAKNLFATRSLTKADYDAANARLQETQADVDSAKARIGENQDKIAAARAQLQETEITLQDASLKAPMDGVLLNRNIEVGALAVAGSVGFVMADVTTVKVVFGVPDLLLQDLQLGSSLAITTASLPDIEFDGQITEIAPSADSKSRVFNVEITVSNPKNQLKPGMIASLQVATGRSPEPVAVVPLSAVVRPKDDPDAYAVFVVAVQDDKQVARVRTVKLGTVYGNMIAVTQGVQVGERVIVTGAKLVVDGEHVRIVTP